MARLRTHNNRRTWKQRRRTRRNRMMNKPSVKRWMKRATQMLAASLGCPERPWFKLEIAE